jgi:hypothetical protein
VNTIPIIPVSVWTPTGIQSATQFEVRYVNYIRGTAVADCHLHTGGETSVEVSSQLVPATEEQCDAWADDAAFYRVLAQNAGLTPV